jgi:hypothetical protein
MGWDLEIGLLVRFRILDEEEEGDEEEEEDEEEGRESTEK